MTDWKQHQLEDDDIDDDEDEDEPDEAITLEVDDSYVGFGDD